MSVVRVRKNHKLVRGLGLMASASIMSLMMAGEAQAACVPNPAQPLNNITTDGTIVLCTGVVNTPTITATTNGTRVEVNGSGTNVTGATINLNGNNVVAVRNNGVLNSSFVTLNGAGSTLLWASGGISNNLIVNVTGANSQIIFDNGSQVTQNPGQMTISSAAGESNNVTINPGGGLFASGGNGQYLLTGGTGNQGVVISGALVAPSDGLAIALGDGDDFVVIGATSNFAVQGGGLALFNGGAGNDEFGIQLGGTWNHITVGFETLYLNPGAALALGGTNADATQINVQSGNVTVTSGAPLGVANSGIDIGMFANLNLNYGASANFNHVLTGAGGLNVNSSGNTITFGGNGSGYSGAVSVGAGTTAVVGAANALGTGDIANSGTVSFGDLDLSNNISGTGQVIYNGAASTGDLSGNNTFSGGLDVRSGALRVNSVNALGTGVVTSSTAGGAILQVDNAAPETLANNLTGNLILVKTNTGILDLTGTNTYSGGTLIDRGGVRVDSFARLGTGQVSANANGSLILNYNGAGTLLQTTPFMTGAGSFIKEGNGNVVMNQTSTYTGGTIIRAGRIGLNNGDALGTGDIQIDSGAELGIGGIVLNNNLTGSGLVRKTASNLVELYGDNSGFTGTIQVEDGILYATNGNALGAGTLQIDNGTTARLDNAADTTVLAGLTGSGNFEKQGAGLATLTGNGSTFTGGVSITGGTLQIAGEQNIGNASVFIGSAGTLALDTTGSTQLGNFIYGDGRLIKTGSGTVFITNANTYTGGTDIQQGAIRVIDTSVLGSGPITVQAGAALDLSIAGVQTLNQNVTGAGILRKSDTGDLTLLSNGLTGGVDIIGGRVLVGTAAALGGGPVTTAADTQLVFTNATTEVMSNLISGAGGLTMNGTGSVIIQNANSYTGGTIINSGRIGLNNGQGLGTGNVLVLSGAILGIGNVTLANNVSGAGQIVKTASGVGALTGTNTHSGGVDIQGGSLDVTGNASLGTGTVSIANGAALNYTNNSATTFSNGLTGAGTFNKLGTGQLTFANNFSIGSLNLNAGRTRINTIGTGNVTVGANAALDGTGRIIGNLTNNGTVAPGNSIGTMTVQGNYVHNANSILEIEFDGAGNIDLLDVTGNATLNGGTLRFVSIGGAEGQGGTFLRTGGTLTGTFATVETVGAQLPLAVVYEPNRAFMAPSVLTARPSTFNAQSMAAADTALGFIDSMGVGDVRHGNGNRIWLNGFGAWGKRSASGSTLAYDHDTRGMSGGINFDVGGAVTLGAAIGWAKGDITLGAGGGGGDQSSILGSINARYSSTGFTVGGGLLYGKVDQDTLRNVSFNGFSGSVDGSTDSKVFGGFAELGLPLGSTGGWAFSANARGSYVRQKQDSYTESGTSPLRLTLGDLKTSTLEGQAKLTAKTSLWAPETYAEDHNQGLDLRIDLGGRYLGTLGDREIPVTFAVSNAGILLQGDTRNTLQGLFGLALDYTTRGGATFSFGYQGEVGKTDRHAVQAGVSFAF
jgi:autotransporter-associated beta strand protein